MKVNELISILQKCNPDLDVLMEDSRTSNPNNVIPVSMVLIGDDELSNSVIFVRDPDEYDDEEYMAGTEEQKEYQLCEADLPLETM